MRRLLITAQIFEKLDEALEVILLAEKKADVLEKLD